MKTLREHEEAERKAYLAFEHHCDSVNRLRAELETAEASMRAARHTWDTARVELSNERTKAKMMADLVHMNKEGDGQ